MASNLDSPNLRVAPGYRTMLTLLAQAFGIVDAEEQRCTLRALVELMKAGASVSIALARMPANLDRSSVNAGTAFAAPRNASYGPLAYRAPRANDFP